MAAAGDGALAEELERALQVRVDMLLDPAEGCFKLSRETMQDLSRDQKK